MAALDETWIVGLSFCFDHGKGFETIDLQKPSTNANPDTKDSVDR